MADMIALADLPQTIPVFPLPGAILLPRTRLPLQIFEPRYLAMLDDVLKSQPRLIGMVQPSESASGLQQIGCVGKLMAFSETDDGRYMITLAGVSRFRIIQEQQGFTPYRRCTVDWQEFAADKGGVESDVEFNRPAFTQQLLRYLEGQGMSTDLAALDDADDETLINALAMLCPFQPEEKQALLEARTLADRRETLETLMAIAQRGGAAKEMMQ